MKSVPIEALKPVSRPKWQWKSNSDPWSKTEEAEWTSYSLEDNFLIEKAFQQKQEEVDLEDHIVLVQRLIQRKKTNTVLQRPIRRVDYDLEEDETEIRSERYFETELPKSINNVFGNLGHFVSFFSRRNPEIFDITRQFQEFEQSNDLGGFNTAIRPRLVHSLEQELLKPIQDQLQDKSISEYGKRSLLRKRKRHEELVMLFKKEFASFEELYGLVITSYTMGTDLYIKLNRYLRNEHWTAFDNLLPYAICLCKAFFSFKPSVPLQEEEKLPETESPMILYRGTALDEVALQSYMTKTSSKLFSWNSVTSTSTNKKMAQNFMYLGTEIGNKKYPVMFIIEIPPLTKTGIGSEYLKWINIRHYSVKPKEDEVILPPGSVFEIQQIFTDENQRTTINLKLKHDIESLAHGGLIMQGALQKEMMMDKQAKIMCLEGQELSEAFKAISGNRLIEELEFCLCTFNSRTLGEMLDLLPSLKQVENLKLISCQYEDGKGLSDAEKGCNVSKIEMTEFQDFYQIFRNDKYWISLRELKIDLTRQTINGTGLQGLEHLTQLTSLSLNFSRCQSITDTELSSLAWKGLEYLTQLVCLTLDFSHCKEITTQGINPLMSIVIRRLVRLTSLNLNLSHNDRRRDEEIDKLATGGIKHLTQLTSLTLDLRFCSSISSPGVNSLSHGLKDLTKLTYLTLRLSDPPVRVPRGFCGHGNLPKYNLDDVADQCFEHLPQLSSLILDDRVFTQAGNQEKDKSDEELNMDCHPQPEIMIKRKVDYPVLDNFRSSTPPLETEDYSSPSELLKQGIQQFFWHLMGSERVNNALTLALAILECYPDEFLKKNGIRKDLHPSITSPEILFQVYPLTSLELGFSGHGGASDEGLKNVTFGGLQYLTNLTSLTLSLSICFQITDQGVNDLVCQGLRSLTQLTSLDLNLSECHGVTDKGVQKLATEGLKYLTQLTSLTLSFNYLSGVTDEGVNDLACQGLQYLTHLTSLTLHFSHCSEITDSGMNHLASKGLKYLPQLTSLALHFPRSSKITCEGIRNLASEGLKGLVRLTSLTLNFSQSSKIAGEGVKNLALGGLKYLIELTSLTLDFSQSQEIAAGALKSLACQAIKYLTQLTSLNLNFNDCEKITDEGLNSLISHGIKHLYQLTFLRLSFVRCDISEFTKSNIIRVLHYFGFKETRDPHCFDRQIRH